MLFACEVLGIAVLAGASLAITGTRTVVNFDAGSPESVYGISQITKVQLDTVLGTFTGAAGSGVLKLQLSYEPAAMGTGEGWGVRTGPVSVDWL